MSLLLLLSAISSGVLSLFLLTRWRTRGALTLAAYLGAVTLWSGAGVLELVVTEPALAFRCSMSGALGYVLAVPLFLVFTLVYTGRERWLELPWKLALWAIPALVLLAIVFNDQLFLFWTLRSPELYQRYNDVQQYGPAMWVSVVYSYAAMFLANGLLLLSSRTGSTALRRQLLILMASTLLPFITAGLYLLDLPQLHGVDFSSTGFGMMGLVLAWALYKHRLLDLTPVGRAMLQRHMPDGMVMLDPRGRVVDVNPSALRLLGTKNATIDKLLQQIPELEHVLQQEHEARRALTIPERNLHLEAQLVPLKEEGGPLMGRLLLLRDVTARVHAEQAREELIVQLQQALGDIRVLRGMLPICSSCKKIRDDGGYWRQIEVYIRDHTDAEFSHSLCPECVTRLYPDLELDSPPTEP